MTELDIAISNLIPHPASAAPTLAEIAECERWFEADGQIDPCDVWPMPDNDDGTAYLLLDGRRRLATAERLGWASLRCRIRFPEAPREEADAFACRRNQQRRTESDYRKDNWACWLRDNGRKSDEVAQLLGEPASTTRQRFRVSKLPVAWRLAADGSSPTPRRVLVAAATYADQPEILAALESTGRLKDGSFADDIPRLVDVLKARHKPAPIAAPEFTVDADAVEEVLPAGPPETDASLRHEADAIVASISPAGADRRGQEPTPEEATAAAEEAAAKPLPVTAPKGVLPVTPPTPGDSQGRAELLAKMRSGWTRAVLLDAVADKLSASAKPFEKSVAVLLGEVIAADRETLVEPLVSLPTVRGLVAALKIDRLSVWATHAGPTKSREWDDLLAFHAKSELESLCDTWDVPHVALKTVDQLTAGLTTAARSYPCPEWFR